MEAQAKGLEIVHLIQTEAQHNKLVTHYSIRMGRLYRESEIALLALTERLAKKLAHKQFVIRI